MSSTTSKIGSARPFGRFEWSVARRYLGATRKGAGVSLISIIAFAGIMLSVATLIVVMSVFQGFRVMLLSQLLSVSGHVYVTEDGLPMTEYEGRVEALSAEPYVERVTPILNVDSYFVTDWGQAPARIVGIERDDLFAIEEVSSPQSLLDGSLETFGQGRKGGDQIAMGYRIANQLGVRAGDPVTVITAGGQETAFGRPPTTQKNYQVAARFSVGNTYYDKLFVFMPLEQAQLFARKPGEITEIELRVTDPLEIDQYIERIRAAAGPGAIIDDWRQRNSDIFNAVQTERGIMRILMLMIVLVATMLIISGLVMLVKDKRSDIAVMRTMGASEGMVMRMFMLTGATIGVTGAAAGVGLGALIIANLEHIERVLSALFGFRLFNPNLYYLDSIPAVFEWREVGIVVVFTLAMSFIFSAYPAWRASRVDPVEALRYE
ncbi:lipoprotein-releasing ABC transporter permease subunit [Parvularcula marina]|uniref:Lipoprotein-releasing ABC transporter permease subunit n=1 Tax=Parvularcula marina TaxID=2292771 RepID=A0A371R874_9PROT|nr:lipoprotein-releasing ABC transporter permease subunit [Parvularcula marina]RFB01663.1 lipoprotein-releasing ABC transporter permease subunit [Parvularcula marina]